MTDKRPSKLRMMYYRKDVRAEELYRAAKQMGIYHKYLDQIHTYQNHLFIDDMDCRFGKSF